MRITVLLTQSLESPSGLGRYWPIAKELRRLNHQVTVLALHHDYSGIRQRRFVREGVKVEYVGQMHVRKVGSDKLYFTTGQLVRVLVGGALGLLRAAACVSTDVYHIAKPHPQNGIAALGARLLRPRSAVYLDCDDYEVASNRFSSKWQLWGIQAAEESIPSLARGITANTHFTIDRLARSGYPESQMRYVPNGVDRSRFQWVNASDAVRLRSALGCEDRPVVLYAGSLSLVSHPLDLLLSAFHTVLQEIPEAILCVVGGGEDLISLRAMAKELDIQRSVMFVGRISPDSVPQYYQMADVSVDPVHNDLVAQSRSPLKVVESIVCGTPVVTGDTGDRREMLADGDLGVLVAPGSVPSLAEGIVRVLSDPLLRAAISAKALQSRESWYWDHLIGDFASVYG